jgi:hypothetical protein
MLTYDGSAGFQASRGCSPSVSYRAAKVWLFLGSCLVSAIFDNC